MRLMTASFASALALTIVSSALAGPDWVEDGDAGASIQTAQPITNVQGGQVKRIIGQAQAAAREVLEDRRPTLDALSERLLEKEVIESDELKAIMGPLPAKSPDAVPPEIPPPAPV